ncbi:MAG: hypothetical protein KME26_15655 [Oscillatoria princeps RMCB-10]|jgi:hypothetical protein|nr:hypothetical protein [Oscillatoria princeps RMCB-10]
MFIDIVCLKLISFVNPPQRGYLVSAGFIKALYKYAGKHKPGINKPGFFEKPGFSPAQLAACAPMPNAQSPIPMKREIYLTAPQ